MKDKCPCRQQCIGSSKNSRMLERMLHEEARQEQAKNRNTPEYFSALRLRKIWCEGNFSHQKAEHNLRRTYKRGIERVTEQCLLSACAMNLIRLVKAANAAFFYCLGVTFQGLFHLGGICQQRRNATPWHYYNVFLPGGSDNQWLIDFPSPAFPLCVYKVRLPDVENRKPAMVCSTFATFAG